MPSTVPQGSVVTPIARNSDHLDLFVVGFDEGIYNAWWDQNFDSGRWQVWRRIGRHEHERVPKTNTVTAVARVPNRLDLFVVGHDGGIYTTFWREGQDWADWRRVGRHPHERVPKNNTVTAVARTPNHLDLFVVGHDEGIYTTFWREDENWDDWRRVGRHPHERVPKTNTVTAVARTPNRLDLFVVGHDEGIYTTFRREDENWDDWRRVGRHPHERVPKTNTVTPVARVPNRLDLFVVGKNGGIYTTSRDDGQHWLDWSRIGREEHNVAPNSRVTAVARAPTQLDLYVVGHDGGIYSASWNSQVGITTDFVDWFGANPTAQLATGSLRGASVSLTGPVSAGSDTNGGFPHFDAPFFSPQIPRSDVLEIRGLAGHSFTLRFGLPVRDPLLYFASLASKVEFPPGTVVTKVSGQESFKVVDHTVTGEIGHAGPTGDANGTVRLNGVFDTVSFSVTPLFTAPVGDGINFQVGVPPTGTPPWGEWFRIVAADCIRLHVKVLQAPTSVPVGAMVNSMRQVFEPYGFRVELLTTENLNLPALVNLQVGACVSGTTTPQQDQLFGNRNFVGPNDIVVYFIGSTIPPWGGCAAHPPGRPGAVVVQTATTWTLSHEIGHVLGLRHVDDPPPPAPDSPPARLDFIMTGRFLGNITNPPPDLSIEELVLIRDNRLTDSC